METSELDRFDNAYQCVRNHVEIQKGAIPDGIAVEAYFDSHSSYSPAELMEGSAKLRALKIKNEFLWHVGEEFDGGLKGALGSRPAAQ
jgi:hypothetical protein